MESKLGAPSDRGDDFVRDCVQIIGLSHDLVDGCLEIDKRIGITPVGACRVGEEARDGVEP